jgi:hypothetical protein
MFVVVTRHLSDYCGAGQPLDINFGKIQDINRPTIAKLTLKQTLRKVMLKYFSEEVATKLVDEFINDGTMVKFENMILVKDTENGSSRYSLIQEVNSMIIQCEDRDLVIPSYPLIMAEIFEL